MSKKVTFEEIFEAELKRSAKNPYIKVVKPILCDWKEDFGQENGTFMYKNAVEAAEKLGNLDIFGVLYNAKWENTVTEETTAWADNQKIGTYITSSYKLHYPQMSNDFAKKEWEMAYNLADFSTKNHPFFRATNISTFAVIDPHKKRYMLFDGLRAMEKSCEFRSIRDILDVINAEKTGKYQIDGFLIVPERCLNQTYLDDFSVGFDTFKVYATEEMVRRMAMSKYLRECHRMRMEKRYEENRIKARKTRKKSQKV